MFPILFPSKTSLPTPRGRGHSHARRGAAALALLLACAFTTPDVRSDDWPRFRGPGGAGHAAGSGYPERWGPERNILWKTPLPGPGSSSPIVLGDRVFVTCQTGYGLPGRSPGEMEALERHLFCLDLRDGSIRWRAKLPTRLPEIPYDRRMLSHGYASSTPCADADGVYVFAGRSGVHAFDTAGEPRWTADVGGEVHGWGSAASPVLHGDLVIVNAFTESGDLVALHRETGELAWRASGLKEAWNTPALVTNPRGDTELVMGVFGKVLGFDPGTGESLWECAAADWYVVATCVSADGIVYSLSGKGFEAATAIRTGGRGDVTRTHRLWQTRKGSNVSSPLLAGGHLYFFHDQGSFAYCLDRETGDVVNTVRLPRLDLIYGSPILTGDRIVVFSRDGKGLVLRADPSLEIVAENPPLDDTTVNASPAAVDGRLLIRSDAAVYCLAEPAPGSGNR